MRDCPQEVQLQRVQTNAMCHCTCIFPNSWISGYNLPTTSTEVDAILPMLIQEQILKISCYIFETLQMASSLCSVFMTAIPLMMVFIMFCYFHLETLAGMISFLYTMPEVRVNLPNMGIIHIGCMSAQMNPPTLLHWGKLF